MEKNEPPVPYTVEYSSLVMRHLRQLAAEAFARGDGFEIFTHPRRIAKERVAHVA